MTQRFERAYNALYNAFMNNTLAKGYCVACAVGNILADAQGGKVTVEIENGKVMIDANVENNFWSTLFITTKNGQFFYDDHTDLSKKRKRLILSLTGYTWLELAKVEFAFETACKISGSWYPRHTEQEIMEDQFNGLMAVMDVLIELDSIEEGTEYKETFKNKFTVAQ